MSERELITIRTINNIVPIDGADQIVCALIDGWKVVVKKDEFKPGDSCIFFEIDSFLPAIDNRFDFLAKSKRIWRGKEGYRLKTIKLRGQISQGLALPVSLFPEGIDVLSNSIEKWEEDIHPSLAGQVKGSFPPFLHKTDQERIQNCYDDIDKSAYYEVTLKMDGTSLTIFRYNGELGVCSRNQELKINDENADNLYVKQANLFKNIPDGFAVQAEICGPNIQNNKIGLSSVQAFVFDIFDINYGGYVSNDVRIAMCSKYGWKHVPVIFNGINSHLHTLDTALAYAEQFTYDNGSPAEGVVFKRTNGKSSFKIISNKFLLKYGL